VAQQPRRHAAAPAALHSHEQQAGHRAGRVQRCHRAHQVLLRRRAGGQLEQVAARQLQHPPAVCGHGAGEWVGAFGCVPRWLLVLQGRLSRRPPSSSSTCLRCGHAGAGTVEGGGAGESGCVGCVSCCVTVPPLLAQPILPSSSPPSPLDGTVALWGSMSRQPGVRPALLLGASTPCTPRTRTPCIPCAPCTPRTPRTSWPQCLLPGAGSSAGRPGWG